MHLDMHLRTSLSYSISISPWHQAGFPLEYLGIKTVCLAYITVHPVPHQPIPHQPILGYSHTSTSFISTSIFVPHSFPSTSTNSFNQRCPPLHVNAAIWHIEVSTLCQVHETCFLVTSPLYPWAILNPPNYKADTKSRIISTEFYCPTYKTEIRFSPSSLIQTPSHKKPVLICYHPFQQILDRKKNQEDIHRTVSWQWG